MIYTLTLNPSLDYIVSIDNFRPGATNRTTSELMLPGGKGVNVSQVLKNLGLDNTALGFVAGFSGDEIVRRLDELGIGNKFIKVDEGFSRINLKIKTVEGTEINGQGPYINEEKVQVLMEQLSQLQKGDILFLSGNIPQSISTDVYKKIMEMLDGQGVLIVVDAVRESLLSTLPYHPFLIKPNHYELGEIFCVELRTRESVIPYAKQLKEMGAVNVLVSLAGEGAVLVTNDRKVYQTPTPKGELINGVGAGDSMVAGFMAGYLETLDYENAFYLGVAAGSASAFSEALGTRQEIESLYKQLRGA